MTGADRGGAPPQKIFDFGAQKGEFLCILGAIFLQLN